MFRSQAQNVQDCLAKVRPPFYSIPDVMAPYILVDQLHALVVSAASAGLINEPSQEQRERVRRLEKAEKSRRRVDKDKRGDVKRSRSRKGEWD